MTKERKKRNRKKNVGNIDSMVRVIIGSAILVLGVIAENWWGLIGLIPLISGAISWCPVYRVFGVSTCRKDLELEV
jgi:hypothetical protein